MPRSAFLVQSPMAALLAFLTFHYTTGERHLRHRLIIHVSQAALLQITLATIAAYVVPRKVKGRTLRGFETYGLLFGNVVAASKNTTAYSVEHVVIDPYAKSSRAWVVGSQRFQDTTAEIARQFWPWTSLIGDFHSHPYPGRDRLPSVTGLSNDDRIDYEIRSRRKGKEKQMRIFLVCSIHGLRGRQRTQRRNQLKWTLGQYRLALDAYFGVEGHRSGKLQIVPRHREWPKVRSPKFSRFVVTLTAAGPTVL